MDDIELQFARQELDLDKGIMDGHITVFAEIPDIRVGDVVDIARTLNVRTPFWPNQMFDDFYTQYTIESGYGRRIITVPETLPLTVVPRGAAKKISPQRQDGMLVYRWETTSPDRYEWEDNAPVSYVQGAAISLSSYSDWKDVSLWAEEIYDVDMTLPATLREEMATWRNLSKQEQITRSIRHVQDNIRYVSDVIGLGAYAPRPPALTVERGFGDCKDKTLLLTAMLRHIGVDAIPALVNSTDGPMLQHLAPAPNTFDHVIVMITWKGQRYFIDATWQLQGGVFPDIQQPVYGFALPTDRAFGLIPMADDILEKPDRHVREIYSFEEDGTILLTVTTKRAGYESDNFRITLSESSRRQITEDYLDYYRERYPGLESVSAIDIKDDRDANQLNTEERYSLSAADFSAEELRHNFDYIAYAVNYELPEIDARDRTAPLDIPHPLNAIHEIMVEGAGSHDPMDKVTHDLGALQVNFETVESTDRLHLRWRIQSQSRLVTADKAGAYENARRSFEDHLYMTWDFGEEGSSSDPNWADAFIDAFLGK